MTEAEARRASIDSKSGTGMSPGIIPRGRDLHAAGGGQFRDREDVVFRLALR